MIICPFILKKVAVLTTVKPVTQLALPAVKTASTKFKNFPVWLNPGKVKSDPPPRINNTKEIINRVVGFSFVV